MKKTLVNEIAVEGYLYEHKLEKKVSKAGVEYIGGTISVATDDACSNIVMFYFTYVTPTYSKSGANNPNYRVLSNIIEANNTVMNKGVDGALKVRMNSKIGLNEFYDKEDKLVSQMRNTDGFINVINSLNEDATKRNLFKTDMLINGVYRKEADPEKNIAEHAVIKGAIFDSYTKALLPVSFVIYNAGGIDYFEKIKESTPNPVFTKVWGSIVSTEIVNITETEGAFGDKLVEERRSTRKEYVITNALGTPYDWDSEDTILASELKEAMANRELHLAEIKKRAEEYKNNNTNAAATTTANATVAAGDFKF